MSAAQLALKEMKSVRNALIMHRYQAAAECTDDAIAALDAQLAQAAEPVAWNSDKGKLYTHKQMCNGHSKSPLTPLTPLYATPQQPATLPTSYDSGSFLSVHGGGSEIRLHFNDVASAQAWFERLTDAPQQPAAPEWRQGTPEPGMPVFADTGHKYPIRAMWVAKHTMEVGADDEFEEENYDEATDTYYWPEGWYEWNKHEETHWRVDDPVLGWMPLPTPPRATP